MANGETMMRPVPESPERPGGVIELDGVENPAVRAGVAYWRQISGGRKFPSRADLRPRQFVTILRNVSLLRVLGGGDYEYRIVGDAHVVAHGFSMQGLKLSEIGQYAPGYDALLKQIYDPVAERGFAFAIRGWLLRGEKKQQYLHTESAFLPLGPDDEHVDHVLNFSVYVPSDLKS
jgi:hypothetical protein